MSLPKRGGKTSVRPGVEALEPRRLLCAVVGTTTGTAHRHLLATPAALSSSMQGYTPTQIRRAYGFDQINGDGAGQTIAIVDAFKHPNIVADLNTFDQNFGIAAPPSFQVVSQTGGPVSSVRVDTGWASEIAMDVEWAHAIAPKANILLIETRSDNFPDLMAGVNYARSVAGVSVVSMSWGGSEFRGQLKYDGSFTTPAKHQGVTFVAASGDEGTRHGPEWPATATGVLSVGGTTLAAGTDGTYVSEVGWGRSTGGVSLFESKPGYQYGAHNAARRATPDVAYNADPNTGYAVYSSIKDGGVVGWQELGGTSAGTPQWAAQVAIANELRAAVGKNSLDGATGTLPTLYSLYSAPGTAGYSSYTASLNDIVQGRSGRIGATAGYDEVTGLGSPKAAEVIGALANAANTSVPSVTTQAKSRRRGVPAVARPSDVPPSTVPDTSVPTATESAFVPPSIRTLSSTFVSSVTARAIADSPISVVGRSFVNVAAFSTGSHSAIAFSSVAYLPQSAEGPMPAHVDLPAQAIGVVVSQAIQTAGVTAQTVEAALPMVIDFGRQNATASFADAIAGFAHESAAIGTVVSGAGTHVRAWTVTAAVVGVDVILIGYWRASRKTKSGAKGDDSRFSISRI
jgi:hypothetical protein